MAVARQGSLPPLPLGNQAISRVRTSKSDAESVLNERGDDLSPLEMNESGRSTPFRIRRVGEDDRSKLPSSFPRMPPYGNAADQPSHKVASSLLLQQLLYYNTFYSLGWLAASFGHRNYQVALNNEYSFCCKSKISYLLRKKCSCPLINGKSLSLWNWNFDSASRKRRHLVCVCQFLDLLWTNQTDVWMDG